MSHFLLQVRAAVSPRLRDEPLIFLGHPVAVEAAEMEKMPRVVLSRGKAADGSPLHPAAEAAKAPGGLWTQFQEELSWCYGFKVPLLTRGELFSYDTPEDSAVLDVPRGLKRGILRGDANLLHPEKPRGFELKRG